MVHVLSLKVRMSHWCDKDNLIGLGMTLFPYKWPICKKKKSCFENDHFEGGTELKKRAKVHQTTLWGALHNRKEQCLESESITGAHWYDVNFVIMWGQTRAFQPKCSAISALSVGWHVIGFCHQKLSEDKRNHLSLKTL